MSTAFTGPCLEGPIPVSTPDRSPTLLPHCVLILMHSMPIEGIGSLLHRSCMGRILGIPAFARVISGAEEPWGRVAVDLLYLPVVLI